MGLLELQVVLTVKNLLANVGDVRDTSLIPGTGRSPEGGQGKPLQYSCLENPINRGAWRATVHRVTKSGTSLKGRSTVDFLILSCSPLSSQHLVTDIHMNMSSIKPETGEEGSL